MCRFNFKDNTFGVLDVTLDKKDLYLEETRFYKYDRVQRGRNMTLIYHDYDKRGNHFRTAKLLG